MTPSKRREKAHELRADGLSIRQIAERLHVGRSTVARDLAPPSSAAESQELQPWQRPPFERGNQAAVTHGCFSEQRLQPLRETQSAALSGEFPWLDDGRLAILADLYARIASGRAWLDGKDGIVRDEQGDVFPIVDRIDKWSDRAWRIRTELEQEGRTRGQRVGSMAARMQGEVAAA